MFSAVSRQVARSAKQQCRAFSSTPSVGAAAEVKKLGVIGAGQMVSSSCRLEGGELTCPGSWYCSSSCTEG